MITNSNFTTRQQDAVYKGKCIIERGAATIHKNNIGFELKLKVTLFVPVALESKTWTRLRPKSMLGKNTGWMSTVVHGLVKSREYITPDISTSIILLWSLTTPDVLV